MKKETTVDERYIHSDDTMTCVYEVKNGIFVRCTISIVRSGVITLDAAQFDLLTTWCNDVTKEIK